jgi:hypothetical protein
MSKRFINGKMRKSFSGRDATKDGITYTNMSILSPAILTKVIIREFKNLKLAYLFSAESIEYSMEPIDTRTKVYRKGFKSRSQETMKDFDEIITNGFGVHNNQTDYTLRFSLTPEVVRNPKY